MNNQDLSKIFQQVAYLLEIRGDNIHRVLSYRRAAESLSDAVFDLHELAETNKLTSIPGIGKTLAEKITEILETGHLTFLDRLAQEIPLSILELLRIDGMGPKRVKLVYNELAITNLDQLEKIASNGSLSKLQGFGKKSAAKILKGIQDLRSFGDGKVRLGVALPAAEKILTQLQKLPCVTQAAIGGSVRRRKEEIGDIDLLVATDSPEQVMAIFTTLEIVHEVAAKGPTKSRIIIQDGLGVDLRVLPADNWGTLLSYFTGSQAHNIRLRELAKAKGFSLNEYSFSKLDGTGEILCATEEEVYRMLDMAWVPSELREDRGEIEAAKINALPRLIQDEDILGDLHMHTNWSDGKHTILEMAEAALELGRRYICITDHSHSLAIANGLDHTRLLAQRQEILKAQEIIGDQIKILHGTEMEIQADGSLDFPDEVLESLDFVIAALHTGLSQPRQQVTERMLNAIENPHVDMIAHPTGRLIGRRVGADLDMGQIIEAAARTGTILEVNANPARLDLKDTHVKLALDNQAKIAINTDAHHIDQLKLMPFGVATGRRGWAASENVVNSWHLEQLIRHTSR